MFTYFCSIFGEMERDMIISRQKSSIERLREQNKRWGKGKLLSSDQIQEIYKLKDKGLSYRSIQKEMNVSLGSISKTLNERV